MQWFATSCRGCDVTSVYESVLESKYLQAPHEPYELTRRSAAAFTFWYKNVFLSGAATLIGPLSSLHHAAGTWQEVLDIRDRRLGQVGHGAVAATGGAIVEKVADSGRWVLLEEIITGTEGFLGMKKYNRVSLREMT